MKWTENGSDNFENPEPGTYAAICYKVIDIGTQTSEYQGKQNTRRQVIIGWEISEKMTDGRPFVVSSFFTQSLNEKSNLRKQLEAWRGQVFTEEELKGFDPHKLLAATCMLSLIKTDAGKIRVSSISKLPKGLPAPELHNQCIFFSLDDFDQALFDSFSDGIKKLIVQSPEYKTLSSGGEPPKGEKPVTEDPIPF